MSLTVLSVAYPPAPVGPAAVGGSEQVLTMLDAALVRAGHRSLVIACAGSVTAGTLIPVPRFEGTLTDFQNAELQARHRAVIAEVVRARPVDVVHLHAMDFHAYLPPPGPPALVTLHLPPPWYAAGALSVDRPRTYLHCVSASQRQTCPPGLTLSPDIPNGVPVEALAARHGKRRYVFSLGRICREKGCHCALDAAVRAGFPLLLAGRVFPYAAHEAYFRDCVAPRLDRWRRFIGPVGFARKRRLLTAARALLVPSLAPETSSLVAMEALACGTPVIAFRAGALPDIVEHGVTGFLVDSVEEMAAAIEAAGSINPDVCREAARNRFSVDRMVARYFATYETLAGGAGAREISHAA
jgi:glycosyltransferase involved in cell wall biosynthesis